MRTFLTKNLYVGNFFEKNIELKSWQKIINNFRILEQKNHALHGFNLHKQFRDYGNHLY